MNPALTAVRQIDRARSDNEKDRLVVVYPCKAQRRPRSHESLTRCTAAQKLAALKGCQYGGEFDPSSRYDAPLYFVPSDTLIGIETLQQLGITGEQDFFGGVVPYAFVATKMITHPLVHADAHAPEGWSTQFTDAVREVVLPGYSAFALDDARRAGTQMLRDGDVRIKLASGIGGLGQWVVRDADELEERLQALDSVDVWTNGMALERNLRNVVTFSVGQVRVAGMVATYYGTQRLTENNKGEEVYGGSTLTVARGDFDALLRRDLPDDVRNVIAQTRVYHTAAMTSFPGMAASRSNYDIAQGVDDNGQPHSGVLEQSWRIGGASGAEILALEAFQADPALEVVCASTVEIYGTAPELPSDAVIFYRGIDEKVGPLTKFAKLEPHADL